MLRVATFDITDAEKINELLRVNRIAQGGHILVNDGKVLIPFEDGAEKTNAQKIVDIQEQVNILLDQLAIIHHSQKVLEFLRRDASRRADEAQELVTASQAFFEVQDKKSKERKEAGLKIDEANKAVASANASLREIENQYRMNEHEVLRLTMNIEIYRETIDTLK